MLISCWTISIHLIFHIYRLHLGAFVQINIAIDFEETDSASAAVL